MPILDEAMIPALRDDYKVTCRTSGDASVPFPIQIQKRPYLPVRINGKGPYWFLLETGNVGYTLGCQVAEELGLKAIEEKRVVLDEFTIGTTTWFGIVFGLRNHDEDSAVVGRPVDGMLGNLFWLIQKCAVTVHYENPTAWLYPNGLENSSDMGSEKGSEKGSGVDSGKPLRSVVFQYRQTG